MTGTSPELSVVIPVRDERHNVERVADEIVSALDAAGVSWECQWVDDDSTDGTADVLDSIGRRDARHRVRHLGAHRGQSAALWLGFAATTAPTIATLDGDGQHDPCDLIALYRHMQGNRLDAVVGVRRGRQDPWVRRLSARVATAARRALLGDRLDDAASPVRVFRRECLGSVYAFKGLHRLLVTMLVIEGYRVAQMDVHHRPRITGRSKYGVGNRLWVGVADLLAVAWMRRRGLHIRSESVVSDE